MIRTLRSKIRKRIVLLDAHAIIHRAYHALPTGFTSPSGEPTGALYGLVAMLLKIIVELQPDYLVACYDLPSPTVRHEVYAAYKGTRTKIDDALALQIETSRTVFEAFSIPIYEHEGFEADDLLGTIAYELREEKDLDVIIASGDMDTLQLVDDARVRVYTLKKGLNDTILYDADAVLARYGFSPILIPDFKGLRGDPSDNIKGVPGIGEKTATELITRFGSIEKLYAELKKNEKGVIKKGVTTRITTLLKEHEEDAHFSKALATIRLDAPITFTLPRESWQRSLDFEKVQKLLDNLGFRSLRERARRTLLTNATGTIEQILEPEPMAESIAPRRLAESAVMLWLISSDFTNPSFDDILAFTKQPSFDGAYAELEKQLAGLGRVRDVYERIEKPLVPIVAEMEVYGVLIDPSVLTKLAKNYNADLEKIEKRIYKAASGEFNISSPKQLSEVLFDKLHLMPDRQKKTASGQRSTRESELEKIRDKHLIVNDILEYRELKKLLSTYIENLPPLLDTNNRLHARFIQTGTTTGRMASQDPNLQNIPLHSDRGRAIRHAFVASEDFVLLSLDYSQIELRLAAILSSDEKLCDIFKNNRDIHHEVASMVFNIAPEKVNLEMRRRAKIINFGILYGMGANALRQQLGSTIAEANHFLDDYFNTFTTLKKYIETTKGFARKNGYTETLFGRRRHFPEMKSTLPYVKAQAERMATNAPIQGTQADLIKLAMVECDTMFEKERAREDAHLILQVHDELVYEIRHTRLTELGAHIKNIMQSVLSMKESRGVPILVSSKQGKDWGSMNELP